MFKSRKVIAFLLTLAMIIPMFNVGIIAAEGSGSETFEDAAAAFRENYITNGVDISRVAEANAELRRIYKAYSTLILNNTSYKESYDSIQSNYVDLLYTIWNVDSATEDQYWYFIVDYVDVTDTNNPTHIDSLKYKAVKILKSEIKAGLLANQDHLKAHLPDVLTESEQKYYFSGASITGSNALLSPAAETGASEVLKAAVFHMTCKPTSGWTFDAASGVLTVTESSSVTGPTMLPWYNYREQVTKVILKGTSENKIKLTAPLAFSSNNYPNLTSVELYNVSSLSMSAFSASVGKGTITELKAENVDEFSTTAFANQNITSLSLSNVKTIGKQAFAQTKLTEVYLKDVEVIDQQAFKGCADLRTVTIEGTCISINKDAFDSCSNLKKITYPENTKLYYSNAFEGVIDERILDIIKEDTKLVIDEPVSGELGELDGIYSEKQSGSTDGDTRVSKSAQWGDGAMTSANVGFKFQAEFTQGMDFLFILDTSNSMANLGSESNYYSRYYDMQSKLFDAVKAILTAEGYDNRVAAVMFNTEAQVLFDFTSDFGTVEDKILHPDFSLGSNTNYISALTAAETMIDSRADQTRQIAIIFISDGEPNVDSEGKAYTPDPNVSYGEGKKFVDLVGSDRWNEKVIAPIKEAAANLKTKGIEVYGVLQNVDQAEQEYSATAMDALCDYWFASEDTEEFSAAVNNAIGAAYGVYTLTDKVGDDFTLVEDSILCSKNTTYEISEDGRTITWTIFALPYTIYRMTYEVELNKNDEDVYPVGSFDTNKGDAVITDAEKQKVNSVETPVLERNKPTLIVHYVNEKGEEIKGEDKFVYEIGSEYTVTIPETIGIYYFVMTNDATEGTIYSDIIVTLHYNRKYEITVQPNGKTVVYNGEEQSVSGFENLTFEFDDVYTVHGLTAGASGKNVGTYDVVVTGTPVVRDAGDNDMTYKFIVKIGSAELEITKRDVTFKSETLTKEYDGKPLMADGKVTAEGLVGDDTVTFVADNKSIIYPETLVGGNSFKYFWDDTTNANNYNVTVVYGDLIITDGAYVITVQPNGGEFVYDGTEKSVSGFETLTFEVDGKTYTVEGLTAGATRTNAGETDVAVTGTVRVLDGSRHDVTSSFTVHIGTATLKVNPREVVVTANNNRKTYGDADPELTATVVGTINGDTVDYELAREPGEDVGEYPIVPAGETEQGNYKVTYVPGTFTIDPRPVTVTANNKSKTYGDADPALDAKVEGLLESEIAAYAADADDEINYTLKRVPGENVGEYTITPSGEEKQGNYIVTYVTGTLTIDPKEVTVTPHNSGKVYGDAEPELSATVSGLIGDDTVEYFVARQAGENVGEYGIVAFGDSVQGNYKVIYETATFTITPRTVVVTPKDDEKVYGDADPELTAEVHTLAFYDEIKYDVAREEGENVGEYVITASGEIVQNNGNYIVVYETATFTIDPRPVTVTADSFTKTEGEEDPEFTADVEGTLGSDTVDYDITREPGEEPGEYVITPAGDEEQGNYIVTYVPGTLTITARPTYTVTVHYVDTDGEELKETDVYTFTDGDSYSITTPEIEDYEFQFAVGETEGTVTGNIEITLVYGSTADIPDDNPPTTEPEITEPETTEPEPETTVPEPETTEPEPETTVPEPETTVPEPETTEPETEPAETEPAETEPAETEPAETEPAETEPTETEPAETEPAETEPAETEPAETEPAETEPAETEPAETEPSETEPAETEPAETEPAETEPAETEPAETEPAETEPAETEPAETEPAETEPAETEPAETEPAETEPAETEPETTDTPVVDIPDDDPPLVDIPDDDPPLVDIPDDDPPLGDLPVTGDDNGNSLWIALMMVSTIGTATLVVGYNFRKPKEEEEDETK